MARKANPALIGAFVVGALALAVVGLVLFGGGRFLRLTKPLVAYFEGSVKGVSIGAPVTFQGVKIGSVTDVKVVINQKDLTIHTPLFFEIDADRLTSATGAKIAFHKDSAGMKALVARGLRAELELQSFVTGQVGIALTFKPDTPVRLTGLSPDHFEMPTAPSDIEKLTKSIEQLPIGETMKAVKETVEGIRDLVQSPETKATIRSAQATVEGAQRTLATIEKLARNVDTQVDPLMREVTATAAAARGALGEAQATMARLGPAAEGAIKDYQALAKNLDDRIGRLTASLERTLAEGRQTLAGVNDMLGEDSPLRHNAVVALEELADAAQSIRVLADYLERNPSALVFGK